MCISSLQLLFSQIPEARAGCTMVPRSIPEVLMRMQLEWSQSSVH